MSIQSINYNNELSTLAESSLIKAKKGLLKYSLDLIVQETVNSVVLTDADQKILWVNKSFTKISEYSFEEAVGKKPGELLQGTNTSAEAKKYLIDHINAGLPFQCDILNYSKSGREYWIDIKGQPIFDENGKLIQFFSIQTDITDRIELQKKILDMNSIKDKVISVMSHDVKAPIASLESVLELLSLNVISTEALPAIFEELSTSVHSLSLLVENILGWVKVQLQNPGAIQMTEVNVGEITDNIIALYKPIAQQKNIALINQLPAQTIAVTNSDYLSLIIRNLINNAIKFSSPGQSIELLVIKKTATIEYSVKDHGAGISAPDIQKLFSNESFTTLGTCKEKGSGLGLIFVKESIEKCGGKLFIESTLGEGSRFSFTLPSI